MTDPFQILGTVLEDRYRIDALAGETRFAVAYRALDMRLQTPVAVKVLKPPEGLSADRLHRLLDTLDKVRHLSNEHPAFERILAVKALRLEDYATLYLVLEWLDGTALDAAIQYERQAGNVAQLDDLRTVLDPIAQALGVAHARGMTHGDLGPHNILLLPSPAQSTATAKLLSFGITQATGADPQTFQASAQSEVSAMAVLCREMLAGRSLSDTPGVEEVFRRALALGSDPPYADMRQFWAALAAAARSPVAQTSAVVSPSIAAAKRQRRVAYWIAAGLVPVAVVVFVLIASSGPSKKKRPRDDDDDSRARGRTSSEVTPTAVLASSTPPRPTAPTLPVPPRPPPTRNCAPDMVEIPAGTFAMGSTVAVDEGPIHDVTVAAFCLDRTEVTVAAYAACVAAGSCTVGSLKEYNIDGSGGFSDDCNWEQAGRSNHPINCVSWHQANDFCRYRKRRLPSEEEWEYAARGGSENRTYPWGAAVPAGQMCWNGPGNDAGESSRANTCEVGAYKAGESRWGVMDLGGNVWEWTSSSYCPYTPTGKESCTNTARVARGACWSCYPPIDGRASDRLVDQPTDRFDALGFRCASNPSSP